MIRLSPQYIVDSQGRKKAVVIPIKEFDLLVDRLGDLDDALYLDETDEDSLEFVDYEEVRSELKKEERL